ncbi:MAG: DinB family protein [Steroidobacteraceae bacterium]
MVQVDAYKLLFVGEQIILGLLKDIDEEPNWSVSLAGLNRSFDWVFGHYAAVEDWFLHHLNGDDYLLGQEWQDIYWADDGWAKGPPAKIFDRATVLKGFQDTRQRLYSALKWDIFHLNRCIKPGIFPSDVKTRGDAWLFIAAHAYWHVGEVQSLRALVGGKFEGGGIHH